MHYKFKSQYVSWAKFFFFLSYFIDFFRSLFVSDHQIHVANYFNHRSLSSIWLWWGISDIWFHSLKSLRKNKLNAQILSVSSVVSVVSCCFYFYYLIIWLTEQLSSFITRNLSKMSAEKVKISVTKSRLSHLNTELYWFL